MKNLLFLLLIGTAIAIPKPASANTEPGAYDTRSVALGLTGVAYLDRPAALALNPATLEGINKFSLSLMSNTLLINTTAPVSGPGTSKSTGISLGPLMSFFVAGRVAPRFVLSAGAYLEVGYGADFANVVNVDGEDASILGTDQPTDQKVQFFVAEFALGGSIRVTDKFTIGLALRVPYADQRAELYQNFGAALGTVAYGNIENTLTGWGYPTPKIGFTYKPHPKLTLGAVYRAYSKIRLSGRTVVENLGVDLGAKADWTIPHALQFGGALKLLPEDKLLLIFETRLQFNGAKKHGNLSQTVTPEIGPAIVVPLGWRNVWSLRLGAEYTVSKLVDLRAGFNAAVASTTRKWAQYFTTPAGFSPYASVGAGFHWEKVDLDIAGAFAHIKDKIPASVAGSGPVTFPGIDGPFDLCSTDQVTRTGCAGTYKVLTYWISATFVYKL